MSGKKELEINEAIKDKEVRVIDDDGSQLGVMQSKEAKALASSKNLDLVKISPTAVPPVCKILDYGKYRFELQKKEKEQRKHQKVVELKEIRLSVNIDVGDFNTKVDHAIKFLQIGDKVKTSIRFRGREMAHSQLGVEVMKRFAEAVSAAGNVEKLPKLEGRSMTMIISPALQKEKS